ncbi:MAG TPA: hypothetical protein VNU68_09010 [Verrucomicrobiae bacterium]|jgi:hypothetical protein|nr:hypothetical protein [Verrucomicrobiae bacterium]
MRIEGRQRALTILAAAGLALLVADKLILAPLITGWKQRSVRISELRKSITQGAIVLQRESRIRERWEQMRTHTLPDDVSAAENEVLKAFERWSQDSRISISSIKPQWKRAGDDYVILECRADAFGSIETLARFLYNVEKDPLALKVETVEITSRDDNGQQLALALQVSGLLLNPQAQVQ